MRNDGEMIALAAALKNCSSSPRERYLGLHDERCPKHDIPIETVLNTEGRNPVRRCALCWIEEADLDEQRYDAMLAEEASWDFWPI